MLGLTITAGSVQRASAMGAIVIRSTSQAPWEGAGTIATPSMRSAQMAQTSGFVEHASNEFRRPSVGLSAGTGQLVDPLSAATILAVKWRYRTSGLIEQACFATLSGDRV
jgi:hypothetical protein